MSLTPYYEDEQVTLYNADCVTALEALPTGSVQCVVTSPPYDNLRSYKGYSWDFERTAQQLHRVLCVGGVLCWNVNDSVVDGSETLTSCKQKIYFNEQCGFRIHDTMIYEKVNFSHPEKVRYHQVFEYVFILSKGSPRVFNAIKDKPNTWAGTGTFGVNTHRERDGEMTERKRNIIEPFGMRGNVWKGKTRGQEDICEKLEHPAMMPVWLANDLILSWSKEGDTVLDPFLGSGTTCTVARSLGRRSIGIDISEEYLKMAVSAKIQPAKAEAQKVGQLELIA
jgi:DNA modification methylase